MTGDDSTLTVPAPAKVNLTLRVLGRRPDGYHDLDSVVVPIDLCDELVLTPTAGGEVSLAVEDDAGLPGGGAWAPPPETNLVVRAARRLQREAAGAAPGVSVRLHKRIPVGGGMGGGSADAAAALTGLNQLWRLGLGVDRLAAIGAELGSDVPALVMGCAVRLQGRGERVTPLALGPVPAGGRRWWLVVANPGFGVPTGDVYARWERNRAVTGAATEEEGRRAVTGAAATSAGNSALTPGAECDKNLRLALERGDAEQGVRWLQNDLQAPVFAKYPLLAMLAGALTANGALGALLSGSGASVFGVARDGDHARGVEAGLRTAIGPWLWTRVVRTLPDGVMAAHGPLEARVQVQILVGQPSRRKDKG